MMEIIDRGGNPSSLNDKTDAEADKEAGEGGSSEEPSTSRLTSESEEDSGHNDNPVTVNSEDVIQ